MVQNETIRVFISDDNETARTMLKQALERMPYNIEVVGESSTGQGAIIMLDEDKPHLILLKLNIPGDLPSDEVMATIRGMDPQCYIVLCSYPQDRSILEASIRSGTADNFVEKPIKKAALNRVIEKYVQGKE